MHVLLDGMRTAEPLPRPGSPRRPYVVDFTWTGCAPARDRAFQLVEEQAGADLPGPLLLEVQAQDPYLPGKDQGIDQGAQRGARQRIGICPGDQSSLAVSASRGQGHLRGECSNVLGRTAAPAGRQGLSADCFDATNSSASTAS